MRHQLIGIAFCVLPVSHEHDSMAHRPIRFRRETAIRITMERRGRVLLFETFLSIQSHNMHRKRLQTGHNFVSVHSSTTLVDYNRALRRLLRTTTEQYLLLSSEKTRRCCPPDSTIATAERCRVAFERTFQSYNQEPLLLLSKRRNYDRNLQLLPSVYPQGIQRRLSTKRSLQPLPQLLPSTDQSSK